MMLDKHQATAEQTGRILIQIDRIIEYYSKIFEDIEKIVKEQFKAFDVKIDDKTRILSLTLEISDTSYHIKGIPTIIGDHAAIKYIFYKASTVRDENDGWKVKHDFDDSLTIFAWDEDRITSTNDFAADDGKPANLLPHLAVTHLYYMFANTTEF